MEQKILCRFDDRSLAQLSLKHLCTVFDCSYWELLDGTIVLQCSTEDCASIVERLASMGVSWVRVA